jgi:hypothetical protein
LRSFASSQLDNFRETFERSWAQGTPPLLGLTILTILSHNFIVSALPQAGLGKAVPQSGMTE